MEFFWANLFWAVVAVVLTVVWVFLEGGAK